MLALRFSEARGLRLEHAQPLPQCAPGDALIRVLRAGVCNTDLELIGGYVPGYDGVLGHEFVGVVEACASRPDLVGRRVVGEINCNDARFTHADPIMVRNHAAGRTVLGIIGRDGCMAQQLVLPAENLYPVPDGVTDREACFAEPLAAACRVVEQEVLRPGDRVAVIGDGKLGLLLAQVLAIRGWDHGSLTLFGRHTAKMKLVHGGMHVLVQPGHEDEVACEFAEAFDVVVEACGSPSGMRLALALTRPLGRIVLKSTCAPGGAGAPQWSALANDVVVQEKTIIGSRCGPFPPALEALQDTRVKALLNAMVAAELPLQQAVHAIERAREKGVLKVQLMVAESGGGTATVVPSRLGVTPINE